jgi:hypothetical protein
MSSYRWAGWPAVEVWVRCDGGHLHTVRWDAGRLEAVDHGPPDDESSPCVALTSTWTRHADDLRVLTLAARDAADALVLGAGPSGIPEPRPAHTPGTLPEPPWSIIERPRGDGAFGFATVLGGAAPAVDGSRRDHDIGVLLNLGYGLGERFVTGVAATWAERVATDPDAAIPAPLVVAVEERARRALTTWWGEPVEVTVRADGPATLTAEGADGERAHLTVPVAWLADVWCRDVVLADDAFVLTVSEAHDDHLVVRAALDDLDGDRRITVRLPVTAATPDAPPGPITTAVTAVEPRVYEPEWDEENADPGRPFLVRQLDVYPSYSQLFVTSGFTDVFRDNENAYLDALEDATESRRFVGAVERALIDILLPGWGKPYTPLTIEVWPHTPPDDLIDWDHEVDVDLDVSGTLLLEGSGGGSATDTTLPAGEFRTRVSGRNYDESRSDGGGVELRLRLWRRRRPSGPTLRRTWPGFDLAYPLEPS